MWVKYGKHKKEILINKKQSNQGNNIHTQHLSGKQKDRKNKDWEDNYDFHPLKPWNKISTSKTKRSTEEWRLKMFEKRIVSSLL